MQQYYSLFELLNEEKKIKHAYSLGNSPTVAVISAIIYAGSWVMAVLLQLIECCWLHWKKLRQQNKHLVMAKYTKRYSKQSHLLEVRYL